MLQEKACRTCKTIVTGNICLICRGTDLSKTWRGVVVIMDVNSDIAKSMGVATPGKYALEIK